MPEIHRTSSCAFPVPEEPVNAIRQELPFDVQELKHVTSDEVQADPDISKEQDTVTESHTEKVFFTVTESRVSQEDSKWYRKYSAGNRQRTCKKRICFSVG